MSAPIGRARDPPLLRLGLDAGGKDQCSPRRSCRPAAPSALALLERGIDTLYANDPDEALLLARQERDRIGALVVPGSISLGTLDGLIDRIVHGLPGGIAAILAIAPSLEQREHLRALRERRIGWVLRAPYEAADLRFAVSAALATGDPADPRTGLRVPIRLSAEVGAAEARRGGLIRNLSIGGAYVVLPDPEEQGTPIGVRFYLGDSLVCAEAVVVHRRLQPEPRHTEREIGMGIAFRQLGDPERRLLQEFIRARVESFRL